MIAKLSLISTDRFVLCRLPSERRRAAYCFISELITTTSFTSPFSMAACNSEAPKWWRVGCVWVLTASQSHTDKEMAEKMVDLDQRIIELSIHDSAY